MFRDKIGEGTMAEGNLDGMECDALGNIWTSGPGGVWVLNPAGERIGRITHSRDLWQRRVRRPRSDDVVPHHHHVGAHDADQGSVGAAARPDLSAFSRSPYARRFDDHHTWSTRTSSMTWSRPDGQSDLHRVDGFAVPSPMCRGAGCLIPCRPTRTTQSD